ncbi:hypothetical protein SLEP1_g17884 [Rubroshorea leprosula]|uniref:Uncharacterized protein n=1 Tax=Rubroshorea leprosula TaxID=152421 RepID=A0AAV5J1J0_9ROSI|nr:hypothetical protein SLEP1_g17884 [Rubroshorea leprosula]
MEENLCRDNHRDQPASRELEVPSCWSHFSVHSWSSCSRSSLSPSSRANTSGPWFLPFARAWAR